MNRNITDELRKERSNESYTLEDILFLSDLPVVLKEELKKDQLKRYDVGDIIMPANIYSPASKRDAGAHRVIIMIVDRISQERGYAYKGFLLSSNISKSNKYSRYRNNIYIKDYSTILSKGVPAHKEALVRVDDLVTFTSGDLSPTGTYKGSASPEFLEFISGCYRNYNSGKDNAGIYWEV